MTALERAGIAIANPGKGRDVDWRAEAACAQIGPGSLDYDPVRKPARGRPGYPDPTPLQRVCLACPVLDECTKFAIETEAGELTATHGILAGLTPTQRDAAYGKARAVGSRSVLPGMFEFYRSQVNS